jgi:hypothetical protein
MSAPLALVPAPAPGLPPVNGQDLVLPMAEWLLHAVNTGRMAPCAPTSKQPALSGGRCVAVWMSWHAPGTPALSIASIASAPARDHWCGGALLYVAPSALRGFVAKRLAVSLDEAEKALPYLLCELVHQGMAARPVQPVADSWPGHVKGMTGTPCPERWTWSHWVRPWGVEVYATVFLALGNGSATTSRLRGLVTRLRSVVAMWWGR